MGTELTRGKLWWLCDMSTWLDFITISRIFCMFLDRMRHIRVSYGIVEGGNEAAAGLYLIRVFIHLLAHLVCESQWPGLQLPQLPLDLPSTSTLGPMRVFISMMKGLDFCRTTTQPRLEA